MVISVTTSHPKREQRLEVETHLADFLPRLERQQPGVVAAYHFHDEAPGDSPTMIVWQDEASRLAYRESELIAEPMAMEQRLGLSSTRTTFPLTYP